MDSRNLDHINYSYTDSERAKRNALKKRRRKQLLIQRCVFFLIALLFLILLGKTVFSIKEKLFPKITSSEGNNTSANKAKKKIEFTPIPSDTASLPSDVVTNLNNMAASDKRVAEIVNHYDQYPADLLELLSKNTETPVSLRGEQAGPQIVYGKRQGDRAKPAAAVSRSVRRRKCGVQAFCGAKP